MRKRRLEIAMVILMTVMSIPASAPSISAGTPQVNPRVVRQIRHELATLPYYGVFDWLEFEVKPDNTVVLRGYVTRPTTKSDAEGRVKEIEEVRNVTNEIQVLPLSPNDDRLRIALYRAIYNWNSPLFRYATQAIPSIHIIVDRGRAILKGVVNSKADAQIAYMRARGVPGLFDVKNELVIEGELPR
ncbi:MAG TPA: BON domain-containing protein [Pyrinomonadaceae bacterium]|nr:BON domain-containing protein [Pyrinomonadaceae bacterium]